MEQVNISSLLYALFLYIITHQTVTAFIILI